MRSLQNRIRLYPTFIGSGPRYSLSKNCVVGALLGIQSRHQQQGLEMVEENAVVPAGPTSPAVSQQAKQTPVPLPGSNYPGLASVTSPYADGPMVAPATEISNWCTTLNECLQKADELKQQIRAAEAGGESAQIMTREGMDEFIEELKATASDEVHTMVQTMRSDPSLIQKAGMHELRRTLFYAVTLRNKHWLQDAEYNSLMKGLSNEFLRRDYDGALGADDILFITTHVVMSNYYNRHLWNRMEANLFRARTFDSVDLPTCRGLSVKLFRTKRFASRESLDVRRKVLNAMSSRIGTLANDFELPALLGMLQCYAAHDMMPAQLEPLALRAINHIDDYTPAECATLSKVLRQWNLIKLEVCEKLIERICTAEKMTNGMALMSILSLKSCFHKVAEGGRNAINAEPTKQKLRALSEQIACRLDEVEFRNVHGVITCLEFVLQNKIFVPKCCLENVFKAAEDFVTIQLEGKEDAARRFQTITSEQSRQLQALLIHFGIELCPDLDGKLKQGFQEGIWPDEASL